MKFVYGPVPSRRLGQSLGIDPIPLKTCNWNCIYCQLGRSMPLTNARRQYYPTRAILSEVELAIKPGLEIDWITLVGSGEPTLHTGIGELICGIKQITDLPIAVITNGSLLYLPEVRSALANADVIMPSLDAGSAILYRKINRPWAGLTFELLVSEMGRFQKEFAGELWLETMLMHGINDTETALMDLAATYKRIQPSAVHINLPTRPPAENWVLPAGMQRIERAKEIFGAIATVVTPYDGNFNLNDAETLVEAVMAIISRHPMREEELLELLKDHGTDLVEQTLDELEHCGKAQVIERYGIRFWGSAASFYPKTKKYEELVNEK